MTDRERDETGREPTGTDEDASPDDVALPGDPNEDPEGPGEGEADDGVPGEADEAAGEAEEVEAEEIEAEEVEAPERGDEAEAADVGDLDETVVAPAGRPRAGERVGTGAAAEPLPRVDDRVSRWFVVLAIVAFALILVNGVLFGRGGALSPSPTPEPSISGSPSLSLPPSETPSASPSSAAPSGSGSASAPASPATSPSTSPSPAASPSSS